MVDYQVCRRKLKYQPQISMFPIDSRPYGLSYVEWTIKWWQWLLSIPKQDNPAFDITGINSNLNQNDPDVFFLCETIEGVDKMPNRRCIIPAGRSILMPIINWISVLHVDGETDQELVTTAKKKMDEVADLEITVNGITITEDLREYRAKSAFFDVIFPENNALGVDTGPARCLSDGYWVFLKPLTRDTKLSTVGSCSSGATRLGVNYDILIE